MIDEARTRQEKIFWDPWYLLNEYYEAAPYSEYKKFALWAAIKILRRWEKEGKVPC